MKAFRMLAAALVLVVATGWFSACQKENPVVSNESAEAVDRANPNSRIFPPNARPYGKSIGEWTSLWWEWFFGADACEEFVYPDETGALVGNNQSGPVYFLVGSPVPGTERSVTIPQGKAILVPLINTLWVLCPGEDTGGLSVEEYLSNGAAEFIDTGDNFSVTLDGQTISDLDNYRFTYGLFDFQANQTLAECLGLCWDESLPGWVDGYWVMLKPLSPGEHTLQFHGEALGGEFVQDVTYYITVQ
jgi:hypothetical protein